MAPSSRIGRHSVILLTESKTPDRGGCLPQRAVLALLPASPFPASCRAPVVHPDMFQVST